MTLYKDYPLQNPDSIRVLRLHPGDSDDIIEISVATMRLSATPNFMALSYTWGNPVDERHPSYQEYDLVKYHISCARELLAVQQNLYEALWQLREKQEYSPLWIDAICIDQENQEELNHQLSLMPCIYCDASWIIVWLGQDDATTHEAVQTLDGLQREEILGFQYTMRCEAATQFLKSIPRRRRQALALLFRRRWFNRVWTLQEVLSPKRTRCLCGPHELDIGVASMFAALSLRIASSGPATCDVLKYLDEHSICQLGGAACISAWQGLTWPGGGFGSRALLRYAKIDYKMELPRTFKWLVALELFVYEARQRNCSKLEDKVLAPLAFALYKKFAPETPDFLPLKREARRIIDCRFPALELYPKFTRFMIDSMANLDILSRAHRDVLHNDTTEQLNLPSWVPPFQEAGTTSLIDNLLFTQYNAAIHLGPRRTFERGRTKASELLVRAIMFGCIVQISTHAAPADTLSTWFSHVCNSERYKQELELGNCRDLAHVVTENLGVRLANVNKMEVERQKSIKEYLESNLSAIALMQLNIPVGVFARHPVRSLQTHVATDSAIKANSAN